MAAVENGQMLALDDAGLLVKQRDGQFALGVEFQEALRSDRQLRLAEVEAAGDRREPSGLLGSGGKAQDDPVVGADGGGAIGQRAVYSWKVQVPQTWGLQRWTLVSSTAETW